MRSFVAALAILWALANLLVSLLFLRSAFVATTAVKEGIVSQLSLLVGGAGLEVLAVALVWQSVRIMRGKDPWPASR